MSGLTLEEREEYELRLAMENSMKDSTVPLSAQDMEDLAFFTDNIIPASNDAVKEDTSTEQVLREAAPASSSTSAAKGADDSKLPFTSRVLDSLYKKLAGTQGTENTKENLQSNGLKPKCKICSEPCGKTDVTSSSGAHFHQKCFVCAMCSLPIHGRYLQAEFSELPFHIDCFRCCGCNGLIKGGYSHHGTPPQPYHTECWNELYSPRCCLCNDPLSGYYFKHSFFENEKYCQTHSSTRSCFACGRKEPLSVACGDGFSDLPDGRALCSLCAGTIIVDSSEAADIYRTIVDFMESELRLPIPEGMRDVPILVVDVQSLNDNTNIKGGSLGYHEGTLDLNTINDSAGAGGMEYGSKSGGVAGDQSGPVDNLEGLIAAAPPGTTVRGLTLSTCCEVRHIPSGAFALSKLTKSLQQGNISSMFYEIKEKRDVTAVLVLYGLPRDLIASILAHEAMHVWLKLNDQFPFRMAPKVEEGLCQVVAYLYLESLSVHIGAEKAEKAGGTGAGTLSVGANPVDQEESLRSYFRKQIQEDVNPIYGDGFREAHASVRVLGLETVLSYFQENRELPATEFLCPVVSKS
jgi:hypothetical protein